MRGLPPRIAKLGLPSIAVLAAAGTAFWAADFGASSAAPPSSSPAHPFADRFTAPINQTAQPAPAWLAAANGSEQQYWLFSPNPTYPVTAANFAPDTRSVTTADPTSTGSTNAPGRNANRKPTVFNDAQIASIKKRLNLTKDQEEYWPAVEAMLRRLAWKKTPDSAGGKAIPMAERRLAELDV